MGDRRAGAPIWFAIRLAILAAAGCSGSSEAQRDGATPADTGTDAAVGAGGRGGSGAGGGGGGAGSGGSSGGGGQGTGGGPGTGGSAGAGGQAGAAGVAGTTGTAGTSGSGGRGGAAGGAGRGGASGAAGSSGQPAICRELEMQYASRLPRFLNCSGQNQCGNRASVSPGCSCQLPVQEPAPLELEMLFSLEQQWFDAGCTVPAAPCTMPCSTNTHAACQSGKCVSVP